MTTIEDVKADFERELAMANSDIEANMIRAEYNYRIKKLEEEGHEAYELAYIVPQKMKEDDCGCGKD